MGKVIEPERTVLPTDVPPVDFKWFGGRTLQYWKDGVAAGELKIVKVLNDHTFSGTLQQLPMLSGTWHEPTLPVNLPTFAFKTQSVVSPERQIYTAYQGEAWATTPEAGRNATFLMAGIYTAVVVFEGERFERSGHWFARATVVS